MKADWTNRDAAIGAFLAEQGITRADEVAPLGDLPTFAVPGQDDVVEAVAVDGHLCGAQTEIERD